MGAKYLLVAKGQIPPEPNLVPAFAGDPQVDVYLNTSAYPLALVVPTSISATGPEDAATILSAEGFDPTRTVVIEGEGPAVASSDPAAELHFLARGVNHISLSASAQQEAYLFLSLPYAPGWQARLDGQPVMVWPANLAFSAIYLPAGSHTDHARLPPSAVRSVAGGRGRGVGGRDRVDPESHGAAEAIVRDHGEE